MKKWLTVLLIACLLCNGAMVSFATDFAESGANSDHIGLLQAISVLETDFTADRYASGITRGAFSNYALRLANVPITATADSNSPFDDVKPFHANYTAILTAYGQRIVQGYSGTTFRPDDNITRAEALTMISRAIGFRNDYLTTAGVVKEYQLKNELCGGSYTNGEAIIDGVEMVELLYNALFVDVPVVKIVDTNGVIQYVEQRDENTLKVIHGVEAYKGVVTKNRYTALYSAAGLVPVQSKLNRHRYIIPITV